MPADVGERVRAYLGEKTGLPTEAINAVLEALEAFWRQYPEIAEAAERLAQEANEETR